MKKLLLLLFLIPNLVMGDHLEKTSKSKVYAKYYGCAYEPINRSGTVTIVNKSNKSIEYVQVVEYEDGVEVCTQQNLRKINISPKSARKVQLYTTDGRCRCINHKKRTLWQKTVNGKYVKYNIFHHK